MVLRSRSPSDDESRSLWQLTASHAITFPVWFGFVLSDHMTADYDFRKGDFLRADLLCPQQFQVDVMSILDLDVLSILDLALFKGAGCCLCVDRLDLSHRVLSAA